MRSQLKGLTKAPTQQLAAAAVKLSAGRGQARGIFTSAPAAGSDEPQKQATAAGGEKKATTAEPRDASEAGEHQSFQGVPHDSSEGPNTRTSPEDDQKTGGVQQKGEASSYQPPHQTRGQGRELEPPNDVQ